MTVHMTNIDIKLSNFAAFDKKLSIFTGATLDLKFTNSSTYQSNKFVWVVLDSKPTIHMSEHPDKARRHKEASLEESKSVEIGIYYISNYYT